MPPRRRARFWFSWKSSLVLCSAQHVAGFSRIDVALHVLLEQQAPLFELPGRARHRLHVSGVACIALFERKTRVADGEAAGLGGLERDPLTGGFAAVHVAAGRSAAERRA